MTSDERLIARIQAVNPMPNDDDTRLSTTMLLDAVDRASSRDQVDPLESAVPRPAETRRRIGLLVAGAAFAVALVVGGIAALTLSGEADVVETPTTTIVSTSTTVADPPDAWETIPPLEADAAGTFRTTAFAIPFSFDTGAVQFHRGFEREDWFSIGNNPHTFFAIDVLVVSDSIAEVVEAFRAVHDLYPDAQMTEPVPATVGGAEGVMFETTGLPIVLSDEADHPFITPREVARTGSWSTKTPMVGAGGGAIFVVDVNGQVVVLGYGGVQVSGARDQGAVIEWARNQARALIESIVWKDLAGRP